jgi:hypothetical protein
MQDLLERKITLQTSRGEVEATERASVEALFAEQFKEILDRWPGLKVRNGYGITFNRPHPDYTWDKELMNLYFRERYTKEAWVDDIEPGYYTTSTVDEWELDRLEIIGQVIGRFRTVKPVLLEGLTRIRTTYGPQKSVIGRQIGDLEFQERSLKEADRVRRLAVAKNKLFTDGLTFNEVTVDFLAKHYSQHAKHYFQHRVVKAVAERKGKYARTAQVLVTDNRGVALNYERVKESALDRLVQMSNEFKED